MLVRNTREGQRISKESFHTTRQVWMLGKREGGGRRIGQVKKSEGRKNFMQLQL